MNASWVLAGITLGVFLAAAAGAWWVARRTARPRRRRSIHWKMALLIACGVTFAGYAFWIDSPQRRTTLHEVILDGAPSSELGNVDSVHRVDFHVEHPQIEHDLLIGPHFPAPTTRRADFEVRLAATLTPGDATALLSEELRFSPRSNDTAWPPAYLSFIPSAAGRHTLLLRFLSPEMPPIHVCIGDPLKKNGQRAPGY